MLRSQKRIRVGVIGMHSAGKTVFLTSLINHLLNHDRGRFPLGDGKVDLDCLREDLPVDAGFKRFPYRYYRRQLGAGEWPTKSLACSQYRCRIVVKRSEKRREAVELEFVDLAGERLADLGMANRSYAEWSDTVWEMFDAPECHRLGKDYLSLLDLPSVSADEITASYRQLLARLILDCVPSVTPSTFLLDQDSNYCQTSDEATMVATRIAGLREAGQFAPLPKEVRERAPETAKSFGQNYEEYRHEIVMPLARWFRSCDVLLILIDLTMLLAGGVGMYNGQKRMLRHFVDYLTPGRGRMNRLTDWLVRTTSRGRLSANDIVELATVGRLQMPGIRRLAFVATKADKAHCTDRDNLPGLLHDLTRNLAVQGRHFGNLTVEEFVCAAVNSTVSLDDYPHLAANVAQQSLHGKAGPGRFLTGQVPKNWPDQWERGDFNFSDEDVLPRMPHNFDRAPQQIGLNRVFNFILEDR